VELVRKDGSPDKGSLLLSRQGEEIKVKNRRDNSTGRSASQPSRKAFTHRRPKAVDRGETCDKERGLNKKHLWSCVCLC